MEHMHHVLFLLNRLVTFYNKKFTLRYLLENIIYSLVIFIVITKDVLTYQAI